MMDTPSIAAGRKPSSGVPFRLGVFGDERLARLVGTGSERAFGAIYERYHQPLYRYCRSIVRDDCDAQDALQSTMQVHWSRSGVASAMRRSAHGCSG